MVLHDVAHRARLFIEPPATLHAERLGHRDLHVVDEVAVPDGLEDAVREAQDEDVLDGLLAQVVVDAEDLALVEDAQDPLVELAGRGQVGPERLLDHHPRLRVGVPLPGPGVDHLPGLLPDGADVDRVDDRDGGAELFLELSARARERVLAVVVLALRDRPRPEVAVRPERAAGMHEQDLGPPVPHSVEEDAGAVLGHPRS